MKIHYIHKTFLFHGKLRPMKQKNAPRGIARDARMCQGTFFTSFLREKEIQKNTGFFHEAENGNFVFRTD